MGRRLGKRWKEDKKKKRGLINKTRGCKIRPQKYVRDIELTFALMNCQSLKFKLSSLEENFKTNKSAFILTNETWFKKNDSQLRFMLSDLEDRSNIACIRKDRKISKTGKAHGGVAVFFSKDLMTLKKLPLNVLSQADNRELEILAVKGRIKGIKREIVLF